MLVFSSVFVPTAYANASVASFFGGLISGLTADAAQKHPSNSQNMQLLQATVSPDPSYARGGGDISVTNDGALLSDAGPSGTQTDVGEDLSSNGQISIYIVHKGDTLGSIAKMFGVSVNTIIWANNLADNPISVGQKLIILPVSGIQHTVKKGDTVQSIAKKYKSDVGEILAFNGLSEDTSLSPGDTIIIPDADQEMPKPGKTGPTSRLRGAGNVPDYSGYYMRPISLSEGHKTQGLHGWNGIDIGASIGTAIHASAEGDVIIARESGWNGGYGKYVVIQHSNGTQTLYGHMSSVGISEGSHVSQGQIIGYVGNTGHSTGPHLHFEVRGAKNPF